MGQDKPEIDLQYCSVTKWFSEVKVDAIVPVNGTFIRLRHLRLVPAAIRIKPFLRVHNVSASVL